MPRQKGLPKTGGRKRGCLNQKTRSIAAQAAQSGITPLEVMIEAMRNAYEMGGAAAAFAFAKDAAPYMHPRVAAVELTGKDGGPMQINDPDGEARALALALRLEQSARARESAAAAP